MNSNLSNINGRNRYLRAKIKSDILTVGIRRVERDSGVSHHTLDKVLKGQSVRRKTLAKILKRLPLYRETGKAELGQL